jgi:hypothetical protein
MMGGAMSVVGRDGSDEVATRTQSSKGCTVAAARMA